MSERTPDQQKIAESFNQRWEANARRVGPATEGERIRANEAVIALMAKHGYKDVKAMWVRSPIEATLLGGLLASRREMKKKLHTSPDDGGWLPQIKELFGVGSKATTDWLTAKKVSWHDPESPTITPDHLHYSYVGDMWEGVRETAEDANMESESAQLVRACLREAWRLVNGGNQWSSWPAFAEFERDVMKTKADYSDLDWYLTLAKCAGPRVMHPEFVIFSDFPVKLELDENGTIHGESGPFAEWADGSKMYAHHGRRIPRWVGTPKLLNVDRIKNEANAEYRRIAIEKYGWSRYLVETGAKVLDMDSLTLEGSAPRVLMEDDRGDKILIGTDGSTKRVYSMRVPREVKTCKEAHEAISGFPEDKLVAES